MTALLALVTALAAAYRVPRHRPRRLSDWALTGTLSALAVGMGLQVPSVYEALEYFVGAERLARLPLVDSCALLSAFGTQVVLLYMLHVRTEARVRALRRAAVAVATLALMVLTFASAAPVPGDVAAWRMHLSDPGLRESRGAYLAFLAWAFFDIARLCWRFASVADDQLLRCGLRLIAAGGAVGLGYVVAGALQVVAASRDDVGAVASAYLVSELLSVVATLLVVLGSTLPAIGPRVVRVFRRASPEDCDLECLWRALTDAVPEVVLPTGSGSAGEAVYRRVIEVEDARLALRPYRTPMVQAAAESAVERCGVTKEARPAALEAASLVLALDARDAALSGDTEQATGARLTTPAALPDSRDLQAEVSWLSSVGRWYDDPKLVATAREALVEPTRDVAAGAH
jgi:hypothetical protein